MLVSVHYSKQPPLLDFIGLLQQRKTITWQLSSGFWMGQDLYFVKAIACALKMRMALLAGL